MAKARKPRVINRARTRVRLKGLSNLDRLCRLVRTAEGSGADSGDQSRAERGVAFLWDFDGQPRDVSDDLPPKRAPRASADQASRVKSQAARAEDVQSIAQGESDSLIER
ncbi:MAG: hypothetical protein MI724_11540, partial [Spirochaetales bacterium]|nr:hypothetical protein [Spirochaetales bacterium]